MGLSGGSSYAAPASPCRICRLSGGSQMLERRPGSWTLWVQSLHPFQTSNTILASILLSPGLSRSDEVVWTGPAVKGIPGAEPLEIWTVIGRWECLARRPSTKVGRSRVVANPLPSGVVISLLPLVLLIWAHLRACPLQSPNHPLLCVAPSHGRVGPSPPKWSVLYSEGAWTTYTTSSTSAALFPVP